MLALALLGFGALLLWAAFTGRGANVIGALNMNLPGVSKQTGGASSDGTSGSGGGGQNALDSGTHQGMTSTGDVYTINKSYGDMTDQEKDDANNYAHNIGNMG